MSFQGNAPVTCPLSVPWYDDLGGVNYAQFVNYGKWTYEPPWTVPVDHPFFFNFEAYLMQYTFDLWWRQCIKEPPGINKAAQVFTDAGSISVI